MDLVIVGAGQAGSELAFSARQSGWEGGITLVGDELSLPYQRPPLSKDWLLGEMGDADLLLRTEAAYASANISLHTGASLTRIDRDMKAIALSDGSSLNYDRLALCMGGRARPLVNDSIKEGQTVDNLHYLRNLTDAENIKKSIGPGVQVVIIGGGYVGLEMAAAARTLGARVTLLEMQPRVLSRVAGEDVSRFYERIHKDAGVTIHTDIEVVSVELVDGAIQSVVCRGGQTFRSDVVIAGLGMLPNVEAAIEAGLATAYGIPIDENSCTADANILAAGDCTVQKSHHYGHEMRIESVPNALAQARSAGAWLGGKQKPNQAVPWFWSDQYDLKLQMAGLSQGYDNCVIRGNSDENSFSALYLKGNRLIAIDAVNRPRDFMIVRRSLSKWITADPDELKDDGRSLKELLKTRPLDSGIDLN